MKVLPFQTLCMPAFARILIMEPKERQASLLIHLIKHTHTPAKKKKK